MATIHYPTQVTFYYLWRNTDRYIFYVGMTTKPVEKRFNQHIREAKCYPESRSLKDNIIRGCNYDVSIMPFETATACCWDDIRYREMYWIQEVNKITVLTNCNVPVNYIFHNKQFENI